MKKTGCKYSTYFKNPEERAQKISIAAKGKKSPFKGMTYEEIYGIEKAAELRKIRAEDAHKQKGIPKPNLSKALKGKSYPHMFISRPSCRKGISTIEEYGEERAKEIAKKIYNTRKVRGVSFKGENNPNWQGGLSYGSYSPLFNKQLKEKIRVRDNFICQLCGIPELECDTRLHVHHIDYDKKNSDMNNLISLCPSCHTKTIHDRKHWETYFNETDSNHTTS